MILAYYLQLHESLGPNQMKAAQLPQEYLNLSTIIIFAIIYYSYTAF